MRKKSITERVLMRRVMMKNRGGVATVEKVIFLFVMFAGLSVLIYLFGFSKENAIATCSSKIEYTLCPETERLVRNESQKGRAAKPAVTAVAAVSHLPSTESTIAQELSLNPFAYVGLGIASLLILATTLQLKKKKRPRPIQEEKIIERVKKQLEPRLLPGCVFTKRQKTMSMLLHQLDGAAFDEMRIYHLLSSNVKTVLPETPLAELRKWFLTHHFRHLLVCSASGKLLGIISARDLQRSSVGTAADIMSSELVTVSPDQLVSPAITLMMERRISCLPVTEEGKLMGIVTTTDLLIALQCTLQILNSLGNPNSSISNLNERDQLPR